MLGPLMHSVQFYLVFSNDDGRPRFFHQLAAHLPISGILHPMILGPCFVGGWLKLGGLLVGSLLRCRMTRHTYSSARPIASSLSSSGTGVRQTSRET